MEKPFSQLFHRFFNHVEEIDRILEYSIRGIIREVALPELVKALAGWDEVNDKPQSAKEYAAQLENAEAAAAFAKSQMETGFPILYAHATVAIWASLEALVEDMVVESFQHNPSLLKAEVIRKLKIAFGEYELLTPEERLRFMVKELARQSNADLKQGVNRFETLLEVVDLSGPIIDDLRKTFIEFWAVRNVIVHRANIVDRRLAESCPWLNIKPGELMKVTPISYANYRDTTTKYFTELLVRALVRDGLTREKAEERIYGERLQEN